MAICLFAMATLSGLTAAALSMSRADILTARNYRSATQGLEAAEAGIEHAVQIISNPGVVNLTSDVINIWPGQSAPFAASPNPMTLNAAYSYSVQIFAYNGASGLTGLPADVNRGLLVAQGSGTDNSQRTVRAYIIKSDIPNAPPGAIYLSAENTTNSTFNGNNFGINGNDVNFSDGLPGPKPAVPGLTTKTEANAQEARSSLNNTQSNNIQGAGYIPGSPATPSISAVAGATTTQINQMITDLLALGPPYVVTNSDTNINGGGQFGTEASPQITYFNNPSGVTFGNGNATGYGIMIVDGSLTLNGNLDFVGLVLVRGSTHVTQVTGSANIWGSIWTTEFNLTVGGHADIQYSSEALALANLAGGPLGGALPAPVEIYSWRDSF
jgi:hypothetical protein